MQIKNPVRRIASVPKKVATHVYNRRGRYAAAAGFIAGAVVWNDLSNETKKEAMAFIELKGLKDEFFDSVEHDWQDMV